MAPDIARSLSSGTPSRDCWLIPATCRHRQRLPTPARNASLDPHSRGSRIMPVTVDYYMTLNSPWTYLGSALLAEIAARNDASVNVKPCKFGPIFEQTGGLPLPKRSPQRRAYRMMDLKRWREVRDIPFTLETKY